MKVDFKNINDFLLDINCPLTIFMGQIGSNEYRLVENNETVEVSPFINMPNQLFVSEKDGHIVISAFKVEKSIWLTQWNNQANRLALNVMMKSKNQLLYINKIKKINVKILTPGLNIVQHGTQYRVDVQDVQDFKHVG